MRLIAAMRRARLPLACCILLCSLAAAARTAFAASPMLVTTWGAATPTTIVVGSTAAVTVTVANDGDASATDVALALTIPKQVILSSATPTQGSCVAKSCTLGAIAAGSRVEVALALKARSYGAIILSASASGGGDEYAVDEYQAATRALTLWARPVAVLQLARPTGWKPRANCGATLRTRCLLLHGARIRFVGSAKPVPGTAASRMVTIELQRRTAGRWVAISRLNGSISTATRSRGAVRVLAGPRTAPRGVWRARLVVPQGPTTLGASSRFVYFIRR